MWKAIQVVTTTAHQADARKIAESLVEQRLAACVQISGPIESWYRWEGKLESAQEWRCTIKTREQLYARVAEAVRALHPYEEPQIVAVPIWESSPGYLAWLFAETADADAS